MASQIEGIPSNFHLHFRHAEWKNDLNIHWNASTPTSLNIGSSGFIIAMAAILQDTNMKYASNLGTPNNFWKQWFQFKGPLS